MKPIITRLKLDVTPLPEYKNSWTWKDVPKTKLNVNKTDRQAVGDTPDLSFLYSNNELECVEIGLTDNGTPKMMRNFCWKLVKDYELDPEEIKVAGFIISGMHMTNTIMTFKHGSIGLLYKSRRIKMPTTIKEVSRILPRALKITYNSAREL